VYARAEIHRAIALVEGGHNLSQVSRLTGRFTRSDPRLVQR